MPLQIIRNDITKVACDAIVNAANTSLLGGGGVDGAIHRAAGTQLLAECKTLGGCKTGQAKITLGYRLPCRYVIHTVGPVWRDGMHGEPALLRSCYENALQLALEHGCQSVAFPLISAGAYGYPPEQALRVATDAIGAFLQQQEMEVFLVVFDRRSFSIGQKRFSDIQQFIDDRYVSVHTAKERPRLRPEVQAARASMQSAPPPPADVFSASRAPVPHAPSVAAPEDALAMDALREELRRMDESFSQMLLRKIDEKGMTDAQCYKRANIDRKLFSKIRSDVHYRPSKTTAIAFALALELPLWETQDLLRKAGFALSHSSKFDIIVEYFIRQGNYNVLELNEALFAFDQSLIGA